MIKKTPKWAPQNDHKSFLGQNFFNVSGMTIPNTWCRSNGTLKVILCQNITIHVQKSRVIYQYKKMEKSQSPTAPNRPLLPTLPYIFTYKYKSAYCFQRKWVTCYISELLFRFEGMFDAIINKYFQVLDEIWKHMEKFHQFFFIKIT